MNFHLHQQKLYNPIKRSPPMLAVAITPDSSHALSSGLDFVLRKWDLRSRECTHSWEAGGPLNAITISSSGEWALLSTVMGALLWDLQRWQFIRSFMTNKGGTDDIAYSEKLCMVIGAGEDSLIYRWDLETGEKHTPLVDHQYPVSALTIGDNGAQLLSGDSSGELRLWDLSSGECRKAWQGHDSKITDLALLSHSQRAITVGQDKQIKIWGANKGQQLEKISVHTGWINAFAVNEQEDWMLSAGEDGVRIWDLDSHQNVHSDNSVDIRCLALSPDERDAISGSKDGSLTRWMIERSD